MVELSLLKLCLVKSNWEEANSGGLSISDFPKELHVYYSCISNYHSSSNDSVEITVSDLANLVFATSNKDKEYNEQILVNLEKLDCSDNTSKTLLSSLLSRKKLKELSLLAYEAYEGKAELSRVIELVQGLENKEGLSTEDEEEFVSDDIEQLINHAVNTPGLSWRLKTMNRMLGPLRKGNFGFLFARPETGKTTFLASELSFMAEQAEQPVLWFANEDEGDVVKLRIIQGTFGISIEQLMSNVPYWQEEYNKKIAGRIKLKGAGRISARTIESLCQKWKPSLVVIDQLAHVEGFKDDKKNLALGAAFRWARELAKEHCPVVAVHQAGGTGEGVMWLDMNHVDEVKTAAQAHADWILGIGKRNDDGYESIRYLHLSKNKLMGSKDTDPGLRHGKQECIIRPINGRFEDLF